MIFLISSQMELLFAFSLLKLVRMGMKMSGPLFYAAVAIVFM